MNAAPVLPRCPPQPVLRGQKALVTGASSGIGRAIAIALAEAGADVVVNYSSSEARALETCEQISQLGVKAIAVHGDVSDEAQVKAMFARACRELGTVDILVNNAGLQQDAPLEEMSLEQW